MKNVNIGEESIGLVLRRVQALGGLSFVGGRTYICHDNVINKMFYRLNKFPEFNRC